VKAKDLEGSSQILLLISFNWIILLSQWLYYFDCSKEEKIN